MTTERGHITRRLESFSCIDEDGSDIEVIAWRHMQEVMTERGWRQYPGARFWALADGRRVRLLDRNMFQIEENGMVLLRRETPEEGDEADNGSRRNPAGQAGQPD